MRRALSGYGKLWDYGFRNRVKEIISFTLIRSVIQSTESEILPSHRAAQ